MTDAVTCNECGAPADGEATAKELMDAPERPWVLCVRCHRSLQGMRRVGALRRY
jgi:hypothetical protein